MECMSNLKIGFFTKDENQENFRNEKSKQYIKDAIPLNRNIPVSRTVFLFSPNSTLDIGGLK